MMGGRLIAMGLQTSLQSAPMMGGRLIAMGLQTSLQSAPMMGGKLIAMGLQTSLQLAPMMGGKFIAMGLQTSLQSAPMMGGRVVMASPRDPRMADGFGMERKKDLPFLVAFLFGSLMVLPFHGQVQTKAWKMIKP
jgi:hypothetical protein